MNTLPVIPFGFDFNEKPVRVFKDQDGAPWFVLADVCRVLAIANPRDAASRLDDDEKNTVGITDGTPGNPNQIIINESGLYSVIFTSRKPEAKAFKKWVTSEVLPSIRKTGGYHVDPIINGNTEQITALVTGIIEAINQSKRKPKQPKKSGPMELNAITLENLLIETFKRAEKPLSVKDLSRKLNVKADDIKLRLDIMVAEDIVMMMVPYVGKKGRGRPTVDKYIMGRINKNALSIA